jgi:DnaJ family protein C protein 2
MTFALPCSDPTFPKPQIMASMTLRTRKVEPVGHLYQSYYQNHQANLTGAYKGDDSNEGTPIDESKQNLDSDEEEARDLDAAAEAKLKEAMNKKRKQKQQSSLGDLSKKNHYELLLLEDANATEDQIKKSFRKLSLIYHPDKYEEGKYNESAKAKWLQLGSAYETLMDSFKRRIYDSTMEFDDSIPDATLGPNDDFYDLWGPVFKRNQYWSTDQKKVVPFGDDTTPIKKVISFYNFWEGFVTWRDFKMDDEYDVMQAENRYEKRWMEKENKKMKSDLHKEEKARIVKMVKRAKKIDPRIIRKERDDAEAREKLRLEKENKKKDRQEEFERKAREEKEAAEKIVTDAAEKTRLEIEGRKNKKNFAKIRNDDFK